MNDFDIFATKITTKIGKSQLKLADDLKQINNEVTDTHVALDRTRHDAQEQCILSKQQAYKNISLQEELEKTNAVVRARDDALQKTAVPNGRVGLWHVAQRPARLEKGVLVPARRGVLLGLVRADGLVHHLVELGLAVEVVDEAGFSIDHHHSGHLVKLLLWLCVCAGSRVRCGGETASQRKNSADVERR
jgi:PHD/YefM family antitoxin component YafN of YafNO toxin-antitoxin module